MMVKRPRLFSGRRLVMWASAYRSRTPHGILTLKDAVLLTGHVLLGEEWNDGDPMSWQYPLLPDNSGRATEEQIETARNVLAAHVDHARSNSIDVHFDDHVSDQQWKYVVDRVREHNASQQASVDRAEDTEEFLIGAFLNSAVKTYARHKNGGEFFLMSPAVWSFDAASIRFIDCSLDPADPFRPVLDPPNKHYIFVDEADLRSALIEERLRREAQNVGRKIGGRSYELLPDAKDPEDAVHSRSTANTQGPSWNEPGSFSKPQSGLDDGSQRRRVTDQDVAREAALQAFEGRLPSKGSMTSADLCSRVYAHLPKPTHIKPETILRAVGWKKTGSKYASIGEQ